DETGPSESSSSNSSSCRGLRLNRKTSPRSSQTPLQVLQESIITPPLAIDSTSEGVAQLGQFIVAASRVPLQTRRSPQRGRRAREPGRPHLSKAFVLPSRLFSAPGPRSAFARSALTTGGIAFFDRESVGFLIAKSPYSLVF